MISRMNTSKFNSITGTCLILSGLCVAVWSLLHPWGELAGPHVGRSAQWVTSHSFHFLGGVLGLVGLLGFLDREANEAGMFERAGFGLAFIGTIMFAGTGIFTAFIWPVLAVNAPALTELTGPFLSPPHPLTVVSRVSYSLGYLLFGISLMREHRLARWAGTAITLGAIMLVIPPTPLSSVPWVIFPAGGTLFGIGLAAMGRTVKHGAQPFR